MGTASESRSPTREAILDSALSLFAERGFHGTAVPEIARGAGFAAGTIYRHFSGKEALVNALYQREKGRMMGFFLEDFPWNDAPRAQFRAFFLRLADFGRRWPRSVAFLELQQHLPYLGEESRAAERRILAPIAAFFERTRGLGLTKDFDPAPQIALIWGAYVGLFKAQEMGYLELTDAVIAHAEACCWDAVSAFPGAPREQPS